MATKEQIKDAILKVAGNPVSGVIADLADAFADAVVAIDKPAGDSVKEGATYSTQKEARVTKPAETR